MLFFLSVLLITHLLTHIPPSGLHHTTQNVLRLFTHKIYMFGVLDSYKNYYIFDAVMFFLGDGHT